MDNNLIYEAFKRAFDFAAATTGLIIISPLLTLVAVWIKIDSKGPVFFRQERAGKGGKIFKIFKFRTMVNNASELGQHFTTPSGDWRITKSGEFLRKFNIDELPQLFNVVRGEMSLVGPRPEVPEIVKLYDEEQKKVLSVRPGLTDYASINFRQEGEIMRQSVDLYDDYTRKILPKKITLQLKYIRQRSMGVDIKIIIKTIGSILKHIFSSKK